VADQPNRFANSTLVEQAQNPAAPTGLSQAAQQAADVAGAPPAPVPNRFAGSSLGQEVLDDGSYVPNAQSWYTGANTEGITGGWDTDFWNRAMDQNSRYGEQGILAQQFEQDDATGVVTWDHTSTDGRHEYHFGDVYDNGKLSGNVFEQFDKGTANLMMADILFDAQTKAHIFQDVEIDPKTGEVKSDGGLDAEVQAKREQNNVDIPKQAQQAAFQGEVKDTQQGLLDTVNSDDGIMGLLNKAASLPGAGLGLVGASLNRDSLAEQAARAKTITDMSGRENGSAAQIATGINQWAGFAGKLVLSPLSNTVQGFTDAPYGRR